MQGRVTRTCHRDAPMYCRMWSAWEVEYKPDDKILTMSIKKKKKYFAMHHITITFLKNQLQKNPFFNSQCQKTCKI